MRRVWVVRRRIHVKRRYRRVRFGGVWSLGLVCACLLLASLFIGYFGPNLFGTVP